MSVIEPNTPKGVQIIYIIHVRTSKDCSIVSNGESCLHTPKWWCQMAKYLSAMYQLSSAQQKIRPLGIRSILHCRMCVCMSYHINDSNGSYYSFLYAKMVRHCTSLSFSICHRFDGVANTHTHYLTVDSMCSHLQMLKATKLIFMLNSH